MKKNMGSVDKGIRLSLAAIILILYFTNVVTGTWAIAFLIISGLLIMTSFISWCPIYLPFGISTCKTKTTD